MEERSTTSSAGQWQTAEFLSNDDRILYSVVEQDGNAVVAQEVFTKANARLIAAAPELLEACEQCLSWERCICNEAEIPKCSCLHGQLTNAVAKAKGE